MATILHSSVLPAVLTITPDIDLANVPSDPKAALGYAELRALWKADEDAYNAGLQEEAVLVAVRHARLFLSVRPG